jgi:predicted TIM-barrel fold metal-dependent hydrolase
MLDVDALVRPWFDSLVAGPAGGELALFDAHTHIGRNDPDGFKQSPEQLLEILGRAGARAVVFPMHEPDGYPEANDVAIAAAQDSGGRLVAFCRLDPRSGDPAAEAERCLDAGARGIKLHPRAERFTLGEPRVREIVEVAHERRVPVLIHAGRGIPALGRDTVRLAGELPGARLILAHAAISDLAWLWRVLPEHPNVFVDTAWWNPADLIALFTLVGPGQILWASDSPYGMPITSAVIALRCAVQAGLGSDALRLVAGGQLERLLAGEEPLDGGPPPGVARPLDPIAERVVSHLTSAMGRGFGGGDASESVAIARLACAVGEDDELHDHLSSVLRLLDLYDEHLAPPEDGRPFPSAGRLLVVAMIVARTLDVAVPVLAEAPEPTREVAERGDRDEVPRPG